MPFAASSSTTVMSTEEQSPPALYDPTALIVCIAVVGLLVTAIGFWAIQTYLRRRRAVTPVSEKV
jgi:hypothetical protein